ncbi:TerB family tellurite resistance protein [Dankookia sp. P2]|uniref:TerB family tellurite resistance protein n=1 Tax=Dankookia sp. P2 TaxID=3423955 RepID=UPI003D66B323
MSLWGKIIGGVAGFVTGGPLGAVMGAALGHAADAGGGRGPGGMFGRPSVREAADIAAMLGSKEQLFAISVVVLAAKLAKCDGPVKRPEIDSFKRLFRIPPESLREVGQLFDQARDSADDYRPFAKRLGEAFQDNKGMLEDVLAALFQIAPLGRPADQVRGRLPAAGAARLRAGRAGLRERARDGRTQQQSSSAAAMPTGPDPYAVLGVKRDASDDAVRQAWRQLMRENHPDSLAARGVPPGFVKRATDKVAEINAAWDRVKRERRL